MFKSQNKNISQGNDDAIRCECFSSKLGELVANGGIAYIDNVIQPVKPEDPFVFLKTKNKESDHDAFNGSKECEKMNEIKYYAVRCEDANKRFRAEKGKGFKGLIKREWINAVSDVSLEIEQGEIFGIIGPNGSGKSTLIRMLSTLLLPDSGKIEIFNMDVVKKPYEIRSIINRVSVDASFFKKLSVKENLSYAARLYWCSPSGIT
jgi:ABC-type glutathione transport system ATPase component